MPKNQTENKYDKDRAWRYWNSKPAALRAGTTSELEKAFEELWKQTEKDREVINRTKEQANEKAEASEYYHAIKDGYYYSSMINKGYPRDWNDAREHFVKVLQNCTVETAAMIITVWYKEKWQPLKDVYFEILSA